MKLLKKSHTIVIQSDCGEISKSTDLFVLFVTVSGIEGVRGDGLAFSRHGNCGKHTLFNGGICFLPEAAVNIFEVFLLGLEADLDFLQS